MEWDAILKADLKPFERRIQYKSQKLKVSVPRHRVVFEVNEIYLLTREWWFFGPPQ